MQLAEIFSHKPGDPIVITGVGIDYCGSSQKRGRPDGLDHSVSIGWSAKGIGFGGLSFSAYENTFFVESECMGREFASIVLEALGKKLTEGVAPEAIEHPIADVKIRSIKGWARMKIEGNYFAYKGKGTVELSWTALAPTGSTKVHCKLKWRNGKMSVRKPRTSLVAALRQLPFSKELPFDEE